MLFCADITSRKGRLFPAVQQWTGWRATGSSPPGRELSRGVTAFAFEIQVVQHFYCKCINAVWLIGIEWRENNWHLSWKSILNNRNNMGGIKKTGRKGHWRSRKQHWKEIKEWTGAKLWAWKDTGCPDKICVITESSFFVETVNPIKNGVEVFWQTSGKTRVPSTVSTRSFIEKQKNQKKPQPTPKTQ